MIPNVCAFNTVVSPLLPISSGTCHSQRKIASFCRRSSWKPFPNIKLSSPLGIASKPSLHGEQSRSFHAIPVLGNRRLLPSPPRASTNEPQDLTGKPTFWWRILACIPYFLDTCLFVETVRSIHPLLKGRNWPLVMSPLRITRWFMILYPLVGGLVVERKEWPDFFKSHVIMSFFPVMLFLTAVDGSQELASWMNAGYMSQSRLYWGKIGMHLFLVASFAFMFLILECMRCALCGMHIDVYIDGGRL